MDNIGKVVVAMEVGWDPIGVLTIGYCEVHP
jgi:hypothetical protein